MERGAQVYYEVEDPPVSDRDLAKLGRALEVVRDEIDPWLYVSPDRREEARRDLRERLGKRGVRDEVLLYLAERELLGFGPLDPVLRDRRLENVECMGPGKPLTVVHVDVGRVPTNLSFSREELDRLVARLAFIAGKSLDFRNPKIDNALLPGVGRLTATLGGELTPEGSSFVVRIFPEKPWTIVGLLSRKTLTPEIGAYLWLAVEFKLPILIAGDMGSGKTSYANALLGLIPPDRRIGTAEDVPEFKVPHKNWQRYLTVEKRDIDLLELVKLLLRANVDYIVVNEIRGEEAHAWFQAISTGHGGITTIHADSIESVFNRLDKLGIPPSYLYSLALVVFIKRVKVGGRVERRTAEVLDVVDASARRYNVLFKYDGASDGYVGVSDLWSARSTKRILELSNWSLGELKRQYDLRVEFLRRLMEIHQCEDINDVDKLFDLFLRFYRGYMPEPKCAKAARRREEARPAAPGRRADWILKFTAPPGPKRIVLTAEGGVEVLEAQQVGPGKYVVETGDSVVEVKAVGSGALEYVVEAGGRVWGWGLGGGGGVGGGGRIPLGAAGGGGPPPAAASGETLVKEEVPSGDTLVKEGTTTLVVELPSGPLCLKAGGLSVRLVRGRVDGGGDRAGERAAGTVSAAHFRGEGRGGRLYLVDVGSKNGTVVNGRRLGAGEGAEVGVGSGVRVGGVVGVVDVC